MQDLNTSYLLPHRYKRIGWILIGLYFALLVSYYPPIKLGILRWLYGYLIPYHDFTLMIGLTIVISSRKEKEDEMIRLIRLKSFQYGLYTMVAFYFFWPIFHTLTGITFPFPIFNSIYGMNSVLVLILAIYQFNFYRLRSNEE